MVFLPSLILKSTPKVQDQTKPTILLVLFFGGSFFFTLHWNSPPIVVLFGSKEFSFTSVKFPICEKPGFFCRIIRYCLCCTYLLVTSCFFWTIVTLIESVFVEMTIFTLLKSFHYYNYWFLIFIKLKKRTYFNIL